MLAEDTMNDYDYEIHYSMEQFLSTTLPPLPAKKRLLIGVTLSISGNMLISIAMNIQKHSHNQLADSDRSYLRSVTWWGGLILMGIGEIGNFTAYGFAPASLVAPLGTTAVIANAVIAVMFLKEKIRPRDIMGIALAIIGAFLLVNFSNKKDTVLSGDEIVEYIKHYPFMIYLVLEILSFSFIFYLHLKQNYIRVVTVLLQVALLGSFTVIAAKAVSSMLTLSFSGSNQLLHPIFYIMLVIMILTAIGQVKFLNEAMALFDTTVVMPTNFVFFTISAIMSGIVFYQEFYGLTFLEVFMFLFGAFLSFTGVFFLTGDRNDDLDIQMTRKSRNVVETESSSSTTELNYLPVEADHDSTVNDAFSYSFERK